MKFAFTPEEAQRTASIVAKHLGKYMKVHLEKPFAPDAPYRTSLLANLSGLGMLVEAQGKMDYHRELKELCRWLFAQRMYAELYIATSEESDVVAGQLREIKTDGVGLMVVTDNGSVSVLEKAKNPALIVSPDPTLTYGACRLEVQGSLAKFNNVDRKDGLRDMCELVERETENLALLGVRKKLLKMSNADIQGMNWSSQINTLASPNAHNAGIAPIIGPELKDDLHSFTRGRNLVDHKVLGKRAEQRRQKQFADRMMQGPRLMADLVALQRKIR